MQAKLAQKEDGISLRESKLTQFGVLESPDAAMLGSGKVICALCTANMAALRDGRQLNSHFLSVNGGVNIDPYLTSRWLEDSKSAMHLICGEHAVDLKRDSMTHAAAAALAREDAVLERLFINTAMYVCERKHSYREYEHLLRLQAVNGLDMGNINHGRQACKEMVLMTWQLGLKEIKDFMGTTSTMTGRLPHLGVSADKLTDLAHDQWLIVMIRLNVHGRPVTLFLVVEAVDDSYDGDNEANGFSCYNKLVNTLSLIGIETHQIVATDADGDVTEYGEPNLVPPIPVGMIGAELEAFKSKRHLAQYRSSAFDGEAAFNGNGPELSVKARIHGNHGIGDMSHSVMHDLAHSVDLAIGDAHAADSYVTTKIHPTIKAIYTYYVSSPKRKRRLMKLVADMDKEGVFLELHHLFEVRFISSEWIAIKNFLTNLPAVVKDLEDDLRNGDDMTPSKKAQVGAWLRQIKQFKFVAYCITLVDIHAVNSQFSVVAQSDKLMVIDLPDMVETYRQGIALLASGELGAEATSRLPLLMKGEVDMVRCVAKAMAPSSRGADEGAAGELESDGEDEEDIAEEDAGHVVLTQDDAGEADEDATDGSTTVALAAVTGDIKKRLIDFQKDFLAPLVANFDRRIKIPISAKILQLEGR